MSILYPCYDGNVHLYATTKQLEKNAFTINSQNTNQEICIQVTFSLEIKLQKYVFLAKYDHFLTANVLTVFFEPLLGWECAYVFNNIRTEKEGMYTK